MRTEPEVVLPAERRHVHLLRVLGVGFGLAVIIGNTIGAGILRTPGEVALRLPSLWLFLGVWVAGGLYVLLGAISIAELGTMMPQSGGQFVYAHRALGPYAGFVVGWSDWLSTCGTIGAVSIVIGEYAGVLVPGLAGRAVMIPSVVTVLFALLQWRGIRWGSRTQNLTSVLKALAFIGLVVACFLLGGEGYEAAQASPPATAGPASPITLVAVVLALQAVIYTYDGWTGVIYFSEEVRDPARNIPRALFFGVVSLIGIYLLVNLALLYVLPLSRIAGRELAVGAAAQAIFGAHGDTIIRVLTIISMLSAINACHLMATRVLFAMSRDGLFSQRLVRVNAGGTPTLALLGSTVVALLFILYSRAFEKIIAALAFFFVVNYAISFLSVFILRWREPDRQRPYRAWGYPWTTASVLIGSMAFLAASVSADIHSSLYALLLLALSYPAYLSLRRLARPPLV